MIADLLRPIMMVIFFMPDLPWKPLESHCYIQGILSWTDFCLVEAFDNEGIIK
jgi:hypothetical protein